MASCIECLNVSCAMLDAKRNARLAHTERSVESSVTARMVPSATTSAGSASVTPALGAPRARTVSAHLGSMGWSATNTARVRPTPHSGTATALTCQPAPEQMGAYEETTPLLEEQRKKRKYASSHVEIVVM